MTITLTIENPETEEKLRKFIQSRKEITLDGLRQFVDGFYKQDTPRIPKKDPRKHSHIITRKYDPALVDEVALTHIQDSAKYIHDLRREKR